jgi:pyruvate formate lyase activating enzyme
MIFENIKGLIKTSLIDFPGKIAAVLFVGGCNFRCPYCYNVDLVLTPSQLPTVNQEELARFLDSRRGWLDGVVVSGGEPTIYPDLPQLLSWIKEFGYLVKLDTNGSNPELLQRLIDSSLVDYVSLDVKAPISSGKYQLFTQGNDGAQFVKTAAEILMSSSVPYELRTTVVPGIVSKEDILQIASEFKGARRYYLQQFRAEPRLVDPSFSSVKPYPLEFLYELRNRVSSNFGVCRVRA